MSKIETVCPHCKKANTVEKSSSSDRYELKDIRCAHCSKNWQGNLSETEGLAKSVPVPSSELAALRVQVRAQLNELLKRIDGLLESRAAAARTAKFDTNGRAVEKSDEVKREFLNKALENASALTRLDLQHHAEGGFRNPANEGTLEGRSRPTRLSGVIITANYAAHSGYKTWPV